MRSLVRRGLAAAGVAAVITAGTLVASHPSVVAPASALTAARANQSDSQARVTSAPGLMAAAPYLYLGWGSPPNPTAVMSATGVKWFTMAFILSDGGCNPAWDGTRPLVGGVDAQTIAAIRGAGGDVIPSIGGWSGNKLGQACPDAESLAGAYQKLIDAYALKAIDVDIEAAEFENEATQDRVLGALRLIKQRNPDVITIVTFPTLASGPNSWGQRMISRGAELDAQVDVWTIMPFNFGGSDMGQDTIAASEGLRSRLTSAFGWSDDTAYRHMGISSMNGKTDTGETVDQQDYLTMRDYAQQHHLARFTFWALNRDRPCTGDGDQSSCGGIPQQDWEFTRIAAEYSG